MGRRGPPPKPTALKILTGNPGKRALNKREPQPPRSAPKCPTWLSKEAKREWRFIVPILDKLNVLTEIDGAALAMYCTAFANAVEATRILNAEGLQIKTPWVNKAGFVIVGPDGRTPVGFDVVVHPMLRVQRESSASAKQFLTEFGLTPASRSRLQVPTAASDEVDPLQELINRSKAK